MRQQGKAGVSAASWFGLVVAGLVAAVGLAGCSSTATGSGATSPSLTVPSAATASANSSLEPAVTPVVTPPASPAPLTFVATGSMHTARRYATATLLKNGKVLIAGGDTGGNARTIYASAELYDPATGKFSKTGSMTSARTWASASLLADGRVLIAGGDGCSDPRKCIGAGSGPGRWDTLASAEIYDPAKGSFSAAGSMTTKRNGATETVLPDGRVLIADRSTTADLYDPSSGKFTRVAKQGAYTDGPAVLLPNGKVLVVGASLTGDGSGAYKPFASLFDTANGKFTTIPFSFPAAPSSVTPDLHPTSATLLKSGRALVFVNGYLETYDPSTGACADAGRLPSEGQWYSAAAVSLVDGRVLFVGGAILDPTNGAEVATKTAVVYDPTDESMRQGSLRTARYEATTTLLPDGSVLIAGGRGTDGNELASAELFKP